MPSNRIAYADCFSGISGDMLLAALLDAGAPLAAVKDALKGMGLGCQVECRDGKLAGIAGRRVTINAPGEQTDRHFRDILVLLDNSRLPATVRQRAKKVFTLLAEAEAKVHGCTPDEVHFHEVGAVDTIADVVGVIVALDSLGVGQLYCSALPLAKGWVGCQHGTLPLPAPAVCELLLDVPVYGVDLDAELVTPTGAALVKGLACGFGPLPDCRIEKVGYGLGANERGDGKPNLLRVLIGTAEECSAEEEIEVIETCIDDWHPEGVGYLSERLFSIGALDVVVTAVQMKKNRPGTLLRVLASLDRASELKNLILAESTAIGLRYRKERRMVLERRLGMVSTPFGKVEVKLVRHPGRIRLHPEFESCRKIALQRKIPLQDVYDAVASASPDDFIAGD